MDPIARMAGHQQITMGEDQETGRVYQIRGWNGWSDQSKIRYLRRLAKEYGNEPRMRYMTTAMLERAGVASRDYPAQAAAILKFVQQNTYYVNEANEQIQSPWRSLKSRAADCDDQAILIASMAESIALPWRFALGGFRDVDPVARPETRQAALHLKQIIGDARQPMGARQQAQAQLGGLSKVRVRWVEGQPWKPASYVHIYTMLGNAPFEPTAWAAAEPTIPVRLGHDVVLHGIPAGMQGGADVGGGGGAKAGMGSITGLGASGGFGVSPVVPAAALADDFQPVAGMTRPGDISSAVASYTGIKGSWLDPIVRNVDYYGLMNSIIQGVGIAVATAWVADRMGKRK